MTKYRSRLRNSATACFMTGGGLETTVISYGGIVRATPKRQK